MLPDMARRGDSGPVASSAPPVWVPARLGPAVSESESSEPELISRGLAGPVLRIGSMPQCCGQAIRARVSLRSHGWSREAWSDLASGDSQERRVASAPRSSSRLSRQAQQQRIFLFVPLRLDPPRLGGVLGLPLDVCGHIEIEEGIVIPLHLQVFELPCV
jgi:hypothetical protein